MYKCTYYIYIYDVASGLQPLELLQRVLVQRLRGRQGVLSAGSYIVM